MNSNNSCSGSVRCLFALLSILGIACIGAMLYLQYFAHQAPCPLCILQRYAYLLIAFFAFFAAITRNARTQKIAACLILIAAMGGMIAAARQLWLLKNPMLSCGFDALEPIVDRLPLAYILPSVFKVGGRCDALYPPLFGLSLPAWALIGFSLIVLSVGLGMSMRKCPRS